MEIHKEDLIPKDKHQMKLDLFGLDLMIDQNYSNTIDIYDLLGRYSYDKKTKYRRSVSAEDSQFTRTTLYNGLVVTARVTAANIERTLPDGTKERFFVFPGVREEIIEDVLRKLATEKRAEGFEAASGGNQATMLVGLEFSLYEVYQELKRVRGKIQYSYSEIREALSILSKANLEISTEDKSISVSAPFFPVLAFAEKSKTSDTRSFVCFHPLVTDLIINNKFRRYNYKKALSFVGSYTRLVYKRICNRWTQAGPGHPYRIKLSTLIDAIKTPYKNVYQDKALIQETLEELKRENVIESYDAKPQKIKGKIIDWVFELKATNEFAKQQAANNRVFNRIKEKTTQSSPTAALKFDASDLDYGDEIPFHHER
jgi:hypothetical protein